MAESFDADIIIIGAGTAGLVLANELSKDGTLKIHVCEAGKDWIDHPDTQHVSNYTANFGSERDWQYETLPQNYFNGRRIAQNSGKLLGGSSSMNGGYYAAPSRAGVEAWAKLGNTSWSYDGLKQACLETIQSDIPEQEICQELNLDNHLSDGSKTVGTGPVHVMAELEVHPINKAYFTALRDLGYRTTSSIFNNHSAIGQNLFITQNPLTQLRSDANTAFGTKLKERSNISISLETAVKKIIFHGKSPNVIAKGVEVVTVDGQHRTLLASREVILSAGAFGTPKILELSGIGQPKLLQKHRIPLVIENPNVGERLRNHVMCAVHCELSNEVPTTPIGLKGMAYMRSKDQPGLVEVLQNYESGHEEDTSYVEEVKSIFLDPKEGSCYHFFGFFGVPNSYTFGVISAIPFSQGYTHISSGRYSDKPTIDPRLLSHPLDLEVVARHMKTAANFASQPAMRHYFKLDDNGCPVGAAVFTNPNPAAAKKYIREGAASTYHACGTASMRPRQDGGVVNEQLKVYETLNLRVVDASIIPLLAHGNPMATVYGIAKRASIIIKESLNAEQI